MKKLALGIAIPLAALTLAACGSRNSQQNNSQTSVSSSQVATSGSAVDQNQAVGNSSSLDADKLTPSQTAALVLYYGDAHMPGADSNDYSANMAKSGQGATVKIYEKDSVPKGDGPLYKTYPDGAELLYSVKLTGDSSNKGDRLNSIYYTIAGDKIYFADSDAGIRADGVTPAEMVAYAKEHHGISRVNNVAQNTKIVDLRGEASANSSSASDHSSQNLTTQQLGTLVALYKAPDWFKRGIDGGLYYEDSADSDFGDLQGYSYITANGDPTSFIYFKRNGNDVTVKTVEPQGDQSVAEAPIVTKHITVSGLIRDYYTSQGQKDEVNGYANKLKPESAYREAIANND